MRIRSIKPEFWRSRDIVALPIEDRLLFVGLWSYVDDNGVGRDEEPLIAADLFPHDMARHPRDTLARIQRGLLNLTEAGLIVRYNVDESPFLEITTWKKHQRIDKPNKPRFPTSDHDSAHPRDTLARPSRDPRETPAPGAGEQGIRGSGDQGTNTRSPAPPASTTTNPDQFDEFWSAYPRKVGKQKARTKFTAACKRTDPQVVIDGARRLAADPNLPEAQFIPHPSTWLERDGWDDEPLPPRNTHTTPDERKRAAAGALIGRLPFDDPAPTGWGNYPQQIGRTA